MQATEPTRPEADEDEAANDDGRTTPQAPRPTADEPGPRDVPDDKVIEKTLPPAPGREPRAE
jgi:hypothetical protein